MKYRVLQAIAYSGRFRRGAIVEMPEKQAAAFGPEYLQLVGEVEEAELLTPPAGDGEGEKISSREQELSLMTVPELKAKADELEVEYKASSPKKELVALIIAKEAELLTPPAGDGEGETE